MKLDKILKLQKALKNKHKAPRLLDFNFELSRIEMKLDAYRIGHHKKKGFILKGFPIPVSQNEIYRPGSNGRFVLTRSAQLYKQFFRHWGLAHLHEIKIARAIMEGGQIFSIEIYIPYEREKLFSKAGKTKKIDAQNTLKIFLDCLAEVLGFDDSVFFDVRVVKYPLDAKPNHGVIVAIKNYDCDIYPHVYESENAICSEELSTYLPVS
jgi:Holliday junction resolvase RusA-like endonuclease